MMTNNEIVHDKPDDVVLAEHAAVIRALGKRVVGDIIEIGRRLTECKATLPHGQWLPWLKREFEWSCDKAEKFMRIAKSPYSDAARNLEFSVDGLYLLAAPTTPADLQADVIDRAANGESFTSAQIKKLIDETREQERFAERAATDAELAQSRAKYEQKLAEARVALDRQRTEFEDSLKGKLVLDPKQVAEEAEKITGSLNRKIERLEKRNARFNELEKNRKERAAKPKPDKPPIDNAMLGASTAIGTALTSLASRLTITPLQMIGIETRCLTATGQRLNDRLGSSLKEARMIRAWLTEFIERGETAVKKE